MSPKAIRAARLVACALAGAFAACGGGGGNLPPPGSSGPKVSFDLAQQDVVETAGSANVVVSLDGTSNELVVVPIAQSGTAMAGKHFVLPATEARFDPGETEAILVVDLIPGLALFEPDVELVLTLGDPLNAALGAVIEHHLRIENDDRFAEIEPNDDVIQANDVGGEIGAGRAGTIQGAVDVSGPFDVFAVTAFEDVSVELVLDPESALADVSLWVSDASGTLTDLFDAGGAGVSEVGTIEVAEGQTFYLVAVSLTVSTAYDLFVEGASSVVISAPGAGEGRDLLLDLGADWSAIARALLARKQARIEAHPRIEGWGLWIEEPAGLVHSFVLERDGGH